MVLFMTCGQGTETVEESPSPMEAMSVGEADSLDLDYPVLSDPKREVASQYGVVNAEREVPFRWTFFIGKDGKILFIDKKVKAQTHGADCAAKLKELGVAEHHFHPANPNGICVLLTKPG